jgi:hypothetical protein
MAAKKRPSRKGILKRLEKAMDKIGASKAAVGYTFAEARRARPKLKKKGKSKTRSRKKGSFKPKKIGSWGGKKGKGKAKGRKRDSRGRFV